MYEVYDTAQDVTTTAVGPSYLLHSPSVWLGPQPPADPLLSWLSQG